MTVDEDLHWVDEYSRAAIDLARPREKRLAAEVRRLRGVEGRAVSLLQAAHKREHALVAKLVRIEALPERWRGQQQALQRDYQMYCECAAALEHALRE